MNKFTSRHIFWYGGLTWLSHDIIVQLCGPLDLLDQKPPSSNGCCTLQPWCDEGSLGEAQEEFEVKASVRGIHDYYFTSTFIKINFSLTVLSGFGPSSSCDILWTSKSSSSLVASKSDRLYKNIKFKRWIHKV